MAIALGTNVNSAAAIAAERIVLTYGTFGRSLSVEELDTFATTGEPLALAASLFSDVARRPQTRAPEFEPTD